MINDVNNISNEFYDQEVKSLCKSEKFPIYEWNAFISFDEEIALEEIAACVFDEILNKVTGLVSEDEERN